MRNRSGSRSISSKRSSSFKAGNITSKVILKEKIEAVNLAVIAFGRKLSTGSNSSVKKV